MAAGAPRHIKRRQADTAHDASYTANCADHGDFYGNFEVLCCAPRVAPSPGKVVKTGAQLSHGQIKTLKQSSQQLYQSLGPISAAHGYEL